MQKMGRSKRLVIPRLSLFFDFSLQPGEKKKICMKCCLLCNLEDFDFFDLEMLRPRENDALGQSGVVGVREAKVREIDGVCVAVIGITLHSDYQT
jgi:hypothetical protein